MHNIVVSVPVFVSYRRFSENWVIFERRILTNIISFTTQVLTIFISSFLTRLPGTLHRFSVQIVREVLIVSSDKAHNALNILTEKSLAVSYKPNPLKRYRFHKCRIVWVKFTWLGGCEDAQLWHSCWCVVVFCSGRASPVPTCGPRQWPLLDFHYLSTTRLSLTFCFFRSQSAVQAQFDTSKVGKSFRL